MTKRGFVCGAAVSAGLLLSGAAFAGGLTLGGSRSSTDKLVTFNQSTGELRAEPPGQAIVTFLHSSETQHLIADLSRFLPPDPCLPLARTWNVAVGIEDRTGLRFPIFFDFLLILMSDLQCNATITTNAFSNATPEPMISIAPSGT
jgi:hypothetical protein